MRSNDIIKQKSTEFANAFAHVSNVGAKQIQKYNIDCSDLLEEYHTNDIRNSPRFESLFAALQKIEGPALYYFEVLSSHSSKEIVDAIEEYSRTETPRAIPAIKKNYPNTKILYVGKVKRTMWGRLIQHLGFHTYSTTQGLQLFQWATKLGLVVELTVMEFEPEMENLMAVLENELAESMQPILGKHK